MSQDRIQNLAKNQTISEMFEEKLTTGARTNGADLSSFGDEWNLYA